MYQLTIKKIKKMKRPSLENCGSRKWQRRITEAVGSHGHL
jgi:hypothetical protein